MHTSYSVLNKALLYAAIGIGLPSCVRVPFPDTMASGPSIEQIVARVKCDLAEAVSPALLGEKNTWLQAWTVQASLNFIVNDQSTLTPGAVFTQPLPTETIPGVVTNFGRSFNLGVGAGINTTATTNQTVTFSMSLREITDEIMSHQRLSLCALTDTMDLHSELGLKKWISDALSPARHGYLAAGHHKAPKTAGAAPSSAKAALMAAIAEAEIAKPLPKNIIRYQGKLQETLDEIVKYEIPDPSGKQDASGRHPQMIIAYVDSNLGKKIDHALFLSRLLVTKIAAYIRAIDGESEPTKLKANTALQQAKAVEDSLLPLQLDPPLDTISDQIQFIVAFNASVSPSWTLVHFKGPSPSAGSMASATKTLTHTLNLAMGSPSSPDAANAINALNIATSIGNTLTVTAPR